MKPTLHALLIEDLKTDAELLVMALNHEYEVQCVRVDSKAALMRPFYQNMGCRIK